MLVGMEKEGERRSEGKWGNRFVGKQSGYMKNDDGDGDYVG